MARNNYFRIVLCTVAICFSFAIFDTVDSAKRTTKREVTAKPTIDYKIYPISNRIDYSSYYDADVANFIAESVPDRTLKTRDWFVFVNFHGKQELNTTNTRKRGTRTLKWHTTLNIAANKYSKIGVAHAELATLYRWSKRHARKFVSFTLIPPGTEFNTLLGYAGPQRAEAKVRDGEITEPAEALPGGGIQFRLKEIPAGAIVLTSPASLDFTRAAKARQAAERKIDVAKVFNAALKNYIDKTGNAANVPGDLLEKQLRVGYTRSIEAVIESAFEQVVPE